MTRAPVHHAHPPTIEDQPSTVGCQERLRPPPAPTRVTTFNCAADLDGEQPVLAAAAVLDVDARTARRRSRVAVH